MHDMTALLVELGSVILGLGIVGRFAGRIGLSPIPSPKHCAEVSGSPRSFQLGVTTLERVDRLTEQELSTLTSGNDADGTLRDAYRA